MKLHTLLNRIGNRTKSTWRLFAQKIPHNKKYKPVGVKNLLPTNSESITYLELRPPSVSTLDLTAQFIDDCSSYLKPALAVPCPADYIATIKDGRVYSYNVSNMAIISGENYLIEEASFQWNNDKMSPGKDNAVFKQQGFSKPRKYRGKVFSLLGGGGAIYYYYHWVFDAIPKIGLLKESGQFNDVDYFLVPNYEFRFQKEYMDYFGIGEDKIINGAVETHIQADYLMIASFVRVEDHHPTWACRFLYNAFKIPDTGRKRDKLVYIGRGDASRNRKVQNEAELEEVLKGYGFETHLLAGIPLLEKVRLFNSAKLVVSAHGAGLTNLVFCQPGTKVLEFFPNNYVRHAYYDLANKCDLEYHYILCTPDGAADNSWDGQKVGVFADIDAIKAKVTSLLGAG